MTDEQFISWLKSPQALPTVLVEAVAVVGSTPTNFYLSSAGYVTGPAETPASTAYVACILDGVSVTENLPLDGSASISYGNIEVANSGGERDAWYDYVWKNRPVRVFMGDVRWPRADFRLVFSGLLDDLAPSGAERVALVLRGKEQQINTAMSDTKLGGATTNKDRLLPLCFGECHNVTPLLTDPTSLTYMVHNGPIEGVIEVRDGGVPVSFSVNLSAGTFSLEATPVGEVTASVQGAKFASTYYNTVGQLVKNICKTYGTSPLTDADIDLAAFTAFESAHTQPVGVYLSDRANVLATVQTLAASVGAQVAFDALGIMSLKKVSLPITSASAVSPKSWFLQTAKITSRPEIKAAVKLGYCKNWAVQSNLQSGIVPEHADLFAQEWITATASYPGVAALYGLTEEPEQVETQLLVATDAAVEATRRLDLWSVRRKVIGYTGVADTLLTVLGSGQTITYDRFGLDEGVTGQVVSVTRNWLKRITEIEVLV